MATKAGNLDIDMLSFDDFVHGDFIRQEYALSRVSNYLNRYMDWEDGAKKQSCQNFSEKRDKTIWFLWMQGIDKAPKLVRRCYESLVDNIPKDYEIVVLSKDNLADYLKIPSYILEKYEKGIITNTHLSDIIRAGLLFEHGGCWVDSTVFCMDKIPRFMLEGELFVFRLPGILTRTVIDISSWWIRAEQGSRLMQATWEILKQYWEEEDDLIDYFLFHIIFSKLANEDSECSKIFRKAMYFNSGNAHVLHSVLGKNYSDEEWQAIKQISPVQKLSYKKRFLQGDLDTFYMHIVS